MTERIKELVTTTDAWCDQNFPPDWTERVDEFLPLWNEKFAELIVTDVTDILSTYRGKIIFEDGFEYNCQHPIVAIRKHFGFSLPNMEQGKKEKEHRIPREKPTIGEIVKEREEEAVGFFWIMLFIIGFWTTFFILLDYFFGVK
jgi:hypothetical protein